MLTGMSSATESVPVIAANIGGWETVLILAVGLLLFGAKRLPDLWRGLRLGIRNFKKATKDVAAGLDKEASDAGESLGGIYGKPAAQALTPDNRTAELYDPAVFGTNELPSKAMYSMDDLLTLVRAAHVEELRCQVGSPPILVLRGENHPLEGPALTPAAAEDLLRSVANTTQLRELRENGMVDFIFRFRNTSPFLVHARMLDGEMLFELK